MYFPIYQFSHVRAMNFVECIVVNILHPMVDDSASKDVADISQCIENLDYVAGPSRFSVFLNFLGEQFDA